MNLLIEAEADLKIKQVEFEDITNFLRSLDEQKLELEKQQKSASPNEVAAVAAKLEKTRSDFSRTLTGYLLSKDERNAAQSELKSLRAERETLQTDIDRSNGISIQMHFLKKIHFLILFSIAHF